MKSEAYGPRERIRKKKDFSDLYESGGCFRGKFFNLIFRPNDLGFSRMSAVASRRIGNAVARNRARRRARELFRRRKDLVPGTMDMLVIARQGLGEAAWEDLVRQYQAAMKYVARSRAPRAQ
ncbi:MAG: ribonuclease P protein component [Acidobacteriota bacterium]|nr:ribonuclease P protein component [Acidobacteriota bacterium]